MAYFFGKNILYDSTVSKFKIPVTETVKEKCFKRNNFFKLTIFENFSFSKLKTVEL